MFCVRGSSPWGDKIIWGDIMSNVRYFVLVNNFTCGLNYLVGKKRKCVKNLEDGYLSYKTACNCCDFLYRKKVMQGYDVTCSVISLDI